MFLSKLNISFEKKRGLETVEANRSAAPSSVHDIEQGERASQ